MNKYTKNNIRYTQKQTRYNESYFLYPNISIFITTILLNVKTKLTPLEKRSQHYVCFYSILLISFLICISLKIAYCESILFTKTISIVAHIRELL